mmetsp:Transcript_37650/g.95117  ORF Transcript_37650/g.95117 Transcript_37650/m.95117 type:complete len:423 (+) Transcript_37650:766-2034(+)
MLLLVSCTLLTLLLVVVLLQLPPQHGDARRDLHTSGQRPPLRAIVLGATCARHARALQPAQLLLAPQRVARQLPTPRCLAGVHIHAPRAASTSTLLLQRLHFRHRLQVGIQRSCKVPLSQRLEQLGLLTQQVAVPVAGQPARAPHGLLRGGQVTSQALHARQRQQAGHVARVKLQPLSQHTASSVIVAQVSLQVGPGRPVGHGGLRGGVHGQRAQVQVARHLGVAALRLKPRVQRHELGVLGVVVQRTLKQHPRLVLLAHGGHDARPHRVQVLVGAVQLVRAQAEAASQLELAAHVLDTSGQHVQRLVVGALAQRLRHHHARVHHITLRELRRRPRVQHHARASRGGARWVQHGRVRRRAPQVAGRAPQLGERPLEARPCEQRLHKRHPCSGCCRLLLLLLTVRVSRFFTDCIRVVAGAGCD